MRVLVLHEYYGCDTGCCGHIVQVDGVQKGFQFTHPYTAKTPEDIRQWIIDLVTDECGADHVKDIDFDNCVVIDD